MHSSIGHTCRNYEMKHYLKKWLISLFYFNLFSLTGGASKSNIGAIVGAIIGGVSFAAFVVLFLLWRRNRFVRETFYDVQGYFFFKFVLIRVTY